MEIDRFKVVQPWKQGVQALDGLTGDVVFMRRVSTTQEDPISARDAERGAALLKNLPAHDNVIGFVTSGESGTNYYWVVEFSDNDLFDFIHGRPEDVGMPFVQSTMIQLLTAVTNLHTHGVLHRDLKPENVLVDRGSLGVKVGGFERAMTVYDVYSPLNLATHHYTAPEILLGIAHYGRGIDVWSCGCIFAEMLLGVVLFAGDTEFEQLVSIFSVLGTPSVEDWNELESVPDWQIMPQFQPQILDNLFPAQALDLLLRMLSVNPATRISAEDCLDHPFFNLLVQPKKQRSILFLTQPVL